MKLKVKKSLLGTQFIESIPKKPDKGRVNIPSMRPPVVTIRKRDIVVKDDNMNQTLRGLFNA